MDLCETTTANGELPLSLWTTLQGVNTRPLLFIKADNYFVHLAFHSNAEVPINMIAGYFNNALENVY